jgi:RHS repeat-associated protein
VTQEADSLLENFDPRAETASGKTFQLDDHLGTCCVEVDESGSVISFEEYHPYGTSAYRAWKTGVEVSAKRYRYNGKERDEETSLYYYGARYYAPWLGRWTAADPAGLVDGPGLYNYCRGSPVTLVDPNGMQSSEERLKATAEKALGIGQAAGAGAVAGRAAPAPYSRLEQVVGPEGVEEFKTGGAGATRKKIDESRRKALASVREDPESTPERQLEDIRLREDPNRPPMFMKPKPGDPVSERTKEQSVREALRERGKAAGIRTFNEEEFQAFIFLVTTFGLPALELAAGPAAAVSGAGRAGLRSGTRAAAAESGTLPRAAAAETRTAAQQAAARPATGTSPGSVGAARRLEFEASPKHPVGVAPRPGVSPGPRHGQSALDTSVEIGPNTPRRVGIDYTTGKFVVFDETHPGRTVFGGPARTFHGHVRPWDELTQQMRNALIRAGMVNRRGGIL